MSASHKARPTEETMKVASSFRTTNITSTALIVVLMLLSLLAPARSFVPHYSRAFLLRGGTSSAFSSTSTTKMSAAKPFAVVVQAEVKPDRMDEFLDMIKNNAESSRKEPGCVRFGA